MLPIAKKYSTGLERKKRTCDIYILIEDTESRQAIALGERTCRCLAHISLLVTNLGFLQLPTIPHCYCPLLAASKVPVNKCGLPSYQQDSLCFSNAFI